MPTPEEIEAKVRETLYKAVPKQLSASEIELLKKRVETIRGLNQPG